jgi:hypothetical protein
MTGPLPFASVGTVAWAWVRQPLALASTAAFAAALVEAVGSSIVQGAGAW